MAEKEICWFLTVKCNQGCKYCHRFLNIDDLDYNQNRKILQKIIDSGIKNLTFTGGEALLYPNFINLLKDAKENQIKVKLITNGSILAEKEDMREIFKYLDSITLSIDSVDSNINEKMGRGKNHFSHIKIVLDLLKEENIKIKINTVVNRKNLENLKELGDFLIQYPIEAWRIFKFIPLRETAIVNQSQFEITNEEFENKKDLFESYKKYISKVEYRQENDMETKYVLLMPNGDFMQTINGIDEKVGNVFQDDFKVILQKYERNIIINKFIKESNGGIMKKIRTFIALKNDENMKQVIDSLNSLDFVEIVGSAKNGEDAYNQIINLKPEMVFAEYRLDNLNGLDLIKKSQKELKANTPVFNIITDEYLYDQTKEVVELIGDNFNSLINENDNKRIIDVMNNYKKFLNK